MAYSPIPPMCTVWLSAPSAVSPGQAKCSWWIWCPIPAPGFAHQMPYLRAAVERYRWSSVFSSLTCSTLWSP